MSSSPSVSSFFWSDGAFDYANQWVLAAFAGSKTSFNNGDADFSLYDFEGRTGTSHFT
jgi:hypothetical protein